MKYRSTHKENVKEHKLPKEYLSEMTMQIEIPKENEAQEKSFRSPKKKRICEKESANQYSSSIKNKFFNTEMGNRLWQKRK